MKTPAVISPAQISQWVQSRLSCKVFEPGHSLSADELQALKDLLRLAPSSINGQAWRFVIASSAEGRERLTAAMPEGSPFAYNAIKVRHAAAVVVLCSQRDISSSHIEAVVQAEAAQGRFPNEEMQAQRLAACHNFIGLHRNADDVLPWLQRQTFIALGQALIGLHAMGLDACPIEGFRGDLMDAALGLAEQNLTSVVCLAVGRRSAEDFNAKIPKSRLPEEAVIVEI